MAATMLKEHGVTHGFANLIVIKFRESDALPGNDLVASQYTGGKTPRPSLSSY
jgi:hypothetical protein